MKVNIDGKKELKILNTFLNMQEVLGDISGFEKEVRISGGKKRQEKAKIIGGILMMNPRMSLTDMEKELKIPISTAYDILKRIQREYDMKTVFIRRTK